MNEGLVAEILNEEELVVNIGRSSGVTMGMRFAVLGPTPIEVHDPKTGEVLDTVDREKVRVEAVEVRDRITICATYRTFTYGNVALTGMLNSFKLREERETLRAAENTYPAPLSEEESYVKVGDRVKQVHDPS